MYPILSIKLLIVTNDSQLMRYNTDCWFISIIMMLLLFFVNI